MMRINWLLNAKNVETYFYSGTSATSPVSVLSDTVFTVAGSTPIIIGNRQSPGLETWNRNRSDAEHLASKDPEPEGGFGSGAEIK
jgi:hypothetical protein